MKQVLKICENCIREGVKRGAISTENIKYLNATTLISKRYKCLGWQLWNAAKATCGNSVIGSVKISNE